MVTVTITAITRRDPVPNKLTSADDSTTSTSYVDSTNTPTISSVPDGHNVAFSGTISVPASATTAVRVTESSPASTFLEIITGIGATVNSFANTGVQDSGSTQTCKVQFKTNTGSGTSTIEGGVNDSSSAIFGSARFAYRVKVNDTTFNFPIKLNVDEIGLAMAQSESNSTTNYVVFGPLVHVQNNTTSNDDQQSTLGFGNNISDGGFFMRANDVIEDPIALIEISGDLIEVSP